MKKLIIVAVPEEYKQNTLEPALIYTGVGKINAASTTSQVLTRLMDKDDLPELVINYGTAGSRDLPIGSLVDCTKFFQRDMDVSAMEFKKGQTPFEKHIPIILDFSHIKNPIDKHLLCGTGDSFVTDTEKGDSLIDVYDMEAYALAKLCWIHNIDFVSYKYITDNVNEKSAKNWTENCADGQKLFLEILKKYAQKS